MNRRVFINVEEGHRKFWTVEVDGAYAIFSWGRIGDAPQELTKSFPSSYQALNYAGRKIREKLRRKGYVEIPDPTRPTRKLRRVK